MEARSERRREIFSLLTQLAIPEEEVVKKVVVSNPYNPRPVLFLPGISDASIEQPKKIQD